MAMQEHEYGIGRIPADVDAAAEALATAEALIQQPSVGRWGRCARCREQVPASSLMSSAQGSVCPDCYDDASEANDDDF